MRNIFGEKKKKSSEYYREAALRDPCFSFIHSIRPYMGNPPDEIERFRVLVSAARNKALSLNDTQWHDEYLSWCDWIDSRIEKSIESYQERDERRHRYEEDRRKRDKEINDLLARNPPQ